MLKVGFRVRLLVVKTFRGGKYVLSGSAPPAEAVVHDVTRGFLAQRRASNHIFKHHPPTHNTHTHTHTHIYIYIYINAHTRTSMHTHTHTHVHTQWKLPSIKNQRGSNWTTIYNKPNST